MYNHRVAASGYVCSYFLNPLKLKTMTENQVKDLEVLSKYLDEHELKEIAKEAAYTLFSSALDTKNPHSKQNLDYFVRQGAYEAVVKHAEANAVKLEELSEKLHERVGNMILNLSEYNFPFRELITEAVEAHRETVTDRADEVLTELLSDVDSSSGLYKRVSLSMGDILADHIITHFTKSFGQSDSK